MNLETLLRLKSILNEIEIEKHDEFIVFKNDSVERARTKLGKYCVSRKSLDEAIEETFKNMKEDVSRPEGINAVSDFKDALKKRLEIV